MQRKPRLRFCAGDGVAVVLVLLLAAFSAAAFVPGEQTADSCTVQIFLDGALVQELALDKNASYVIRGEFSNTVVVENGSVFIAESDCPGADCVHSGAISSAGRSIVCLPNRAEVRIVGAQSEVDFVLR